MDWGKKILFLYIGFATLMTFLVIMSFRQKTDLVTQDYYEEELLFQNQIDATKNAYLYQDSIFITMNAEMVTLQFAQTFTSAATGQVYFYKASNSDFDFKFPLELNSKGIQQFTRNTFAKGFYTVKMQWIKNDISYYLEKNIVL